MTALLHVVVLDPLVRIHVRVVGAGVVLDVVLDELEARQADAVERLVVGAAGVANGQRGRAQVAERLQPRGRSAATASLPWR